MQELQAIQPTPGPVLAEERRRLGVRQVDLAARLGMHRVSLRGWERSAEVDPIRAARYIKALRDVVSKAVA